MLSPRSLCVGVAALGLAFAMASVRLRRRYHQSQSLSEQKRHRRRLPADVQILRHQEDQGRAVRRLGRQLLAPHHPRRVRGRSLEVQEHHRDPLHRRRVQAGEADRRYRRSDRAEVRRHRRLPRWRRGDSESDARSDRRGRRGGAVRHRRRVSPARSARTMSIASPKTRSRSASNSPTGWPRRCTAKATSSFSAARRAIR